MTKPYNPDHQFAALDSLGALEALAAVFPGIVDGKTPVNAHDLKESLMSVIADNPMLREWLKSARVLDKENDE